MTIGLLPCPFCGTAIRDDDQEAAGQALLAGGKTNHLSWLHVTEIVGPSFYVECYGCGVEAGYSETEAGAIEAWNTRQSTITPEERSACRVARVAASHETDRLLGIIERLTGEKIEPADAPEPDPFAYFDRNGYPSEP